MTGSANQAPRTHITAHERLVVKRAVKTAMGCGFGRVYDWAGDGFKEHWADSIALGIATNREGVIDTEWLFNLKIAVYEELKLDTLDMATPTRTATGS